MKIFRIIILILITNVFYSCSSHEAVNKEKSINEHFVLATLWMETAAECEALQYQAFNMARYRIEQYIKEPGLKGDEAVILDVDETVLETSLYQTMMIINEFTYPTGWEEFINEADCKPIAGSLDFLYFADSLGLKIFYVSNRNENERTSLTLNLQRYGFPQANEPNILLKTNSSSKEPRRAAVSEKNNILLFVGDNLGDFSDFLNKGSYIERSYSVFTMRHHFGDKFIILPNPTYGDWEGALTQDYWKLTPPERDKIRKGVLRKILEERRIEEGNIKE